MEDLDLLKSKISDLGSELSDLKTLNTLYESRVHLLNI